MNRNNSYYNIYTNNTIYNNIINIVNCKKLKKDFTYHYLYIMHYIRIYPYLDRRYTSSSFIPVNMKVMKKYISYDFAHVLLQDLVNFGLISCDGVMVPNYKSRGYKIKQELLEDRFYLIPIKDEKLNSKITIAVGKEKQDIFKRNDGYSFVTLCMDKVIIDSDHAKKYCVNDFQNMCVDIFNNKFSTVDITSNRLHNNLTNLPTHLRKFINYDGKVLCQIDIKNSQPVFLYSLMKNYNVNKEEMDKYKQVVSEYGFYEFFAEKLNMNLTEANRSDFKKKIFGGVLFDINRKKLSKYETVFKHEFPQIFHVIRRMKTKNYKDISILLQKEESKFIFYVIEAIIKRYGDKIPLLTIHDSIATVKGKESIVMDTMMDFFNKFHNINPKLKREVFA